jgi:predicted phosphoadenosine phosphosulfate sulfurtransferase
VREGMDRIGNLVEVLERIRQQESLHRYFAMAYKLRLGAWYGSSQ